MNIGLIIGIIALFFGLAGCFFALYSLGYFNYLGGKKKSSIPAVSKETLIMRLLSLNDSSKPYHLLKGEETDLIADWKIVDASWYGIFSKSRLKTVYRALLCVDETRHTVRCFEEYGSVSWTAGTSGLTPVVQFRKSHFSGRILFKKSWGVGYAIKDLKTLKVGKVYEYKFDINEIRDPIIKTVEQCGWEWVPVLARRHVTYRSL
jgi:hypothetical protein